MSYRTYRQDKTIKAAAVVQKILGEKVPEGHVLEVTHMAVADLDTANLLMELGYIDLGGVDRILDAQDGAQNYGLHLSGRAWIEAGEQPFGRVTTASDGADVIFSCHGKLWPKE